MKRIMKKILLESVVLGVTLPVCLFAGQEVTGVKHERYWTGTITAVDTQNNTVSGTHWMVGDTFDIGQKCAIDTIDNKEAKLGDLRPGEKARIEYREVEGVRVADRIAELALRYDGTVHSVDQTAGVITMAEAPLYQPFHQPERFRIAGDCKVILLNRHDGSLADLQPGDRISVIYELPKDSAVAYRIREKTTRSDGVVVAIDRSTGTLKVNESSGEKEFTVGDDCQVVLGGMKTGDLKNLVPGEHCRFTYEEVNGINVLDQIAPTRSANTAEKASLRQRS